MNKNTKNISYIIYLLSGILICLYFIWIRILKVRLPTQIIMSWDLGSFFLYTALFLAFTYLTIKKIYPSESKNSVITWLKEKVMILVLIPIIKCYEMSLHRVLDFTLKDFPITNYENVIGENGITLFYKLSSILTLINTKFRFLGVALMIIYLPRLVVSLAFAYDVVIKQEMLIFYKLIIALVIPFVWNIFYSIIKYMYDQYMILILDIYTIIYNPISPNTVNAQKGIGFAINMIRNKDKQPDLPLYVEENIKQFYLKACLIIKMQFIEDFDQAKINSKYTLIKTINLFTLVIYAITFGFLSVNTGISYFY